jgi:predicted RND superfamily exporter protein
LILTLTIILAVLSALTTIVAFLLYIKARMAERSDEPAQSSGLHQEELDRLERRYQSIHFISLFIFVFLGVLILVQLSQRLN